MARITLSLEDKKVLEDDWELMNEERIRAVVSKIDAKLEFLKDLYGKDQHKFSPEETPYAKEGRLELKRNLNSIDGGYANELEPMFLRDLILRCIFSDEDNVISRDMVERSQLWVEHQLKLRYRLWEEDAEHPLNSMCKKVTDAMKKYKTASESDLLRICHVERDGTFDTFMRAMRAMKSAKKLVILRINRNNSPVYGWSEDL